MKPCTPLSLAVKPYNCYPHFYSSSNYDYFSDKFLDAPVEYASLYLTACRTRPPNHPHLSVSYMKFPLFCFLSTFIPSSALFAPLLRARAYICVRACDKHIHIKYKMYRNRLKGDSCETNVSRVSRLSTFDEQICAFLVILMINKHCFGLHCTHDSVSLIKLCAQIMQ